MLKEVSQKSSHKRVQKSTQKSAKNSSASLKSAQKSAKKVFFPKNIAKKSTSNSITSFAMDKSFYQ